MPAAPNPRLVYDALLITSHHDFYKPAVSPHVTGLGLGAALVAELVFSGHLEVRTADGSKLALGDHVASPPADSLGMWLVELVRAEPENLPLPEWLGFLAVSDIYAKTAEHMVVAGLMVQTQQRVRWRRTQVAYEAKDPLIAGAPLARIRGHLTSMARRMPLLDAFLLALTEAVGLSKSLYSQTPSGAHEYAQAHIKALPGPLQAIRGHLAAAVADTAISGGPFLPPNETSQLDRSDHLMSAPTGEPTSMVRSALAKDKLGTLSLLHFSLTAATPLTVIAGGVVVMFALAGQIGIPLGYIVIAACLWLFSVGYITMSRHITNAGAMYAFVARGLGRVTGVGAAWVAATSYSAMQICLYGLLGVTAQSLLARMGLEVTWWVAALAAWLLIGLLGTRAVDVNAKVLAVLLAVEIAVILLFSGSNFLNAADGVPLTPLSPSAFGGEAAGAVLALAFVGFIGFEAPTVYGEEARDRRRTVARATVATIGILAFIYITASWSIITAVGEDDVVAAATADSSGLMFALAGEQMGGAWITIGEVLLLTSVTAAALSFHNTTARYLFALGREKVIPAALGRTSVRACAPATASLTQSAVGGVVLVLWAVLGLDPLTHLFFILGTAAGIGLISLFLASAAAVALYFWRDRRDERVWHARIAPILSFLALGVVLWLSIIHFHTLIGVEKGSLIPRLVPMIFAALALLGIAWGAYLKRAKPEVYAGIGHGAKATLVQSTEPKTAEVAGGR